MPWGGREPLYFTIIHLLKLGGRELLYISLKNLHLVKLVTQDALGGGSPFAVAVIESQVFVLLIYNIYKSKPRVRSCCYWYFQNEIK